MEFVLVLFEPHDGGFSAPVGLFGPEVYYICLRQKQTQAPTLAIRHLKYGQDSSVVARRVLGGSFLINHLTSSKCVLRSAVVVVVFIAHSWQPNLPFFWSQAAFCRTLRLWLKLAILEFGGYG